LTMTAVIIPYEQLSPGALQGVVEEFVTRDGTDYGITEISLDTKVDQVMRQLKNKKAVVVFDSISETCTLLPSHDPVLKGLMLI
jgi:uncharacterized protein